MSFSNVTILYKKLESQPEELREKIAQYITEHFEDIKDELRWDDSFKKTSSKLAKIAREVRKEIGEGKAVEMDYKKL